MPPLLGEPARAAGAASPSSSRASPALSPASSSRVSVPARARPSDGGQARHLPRPHRHGHQHRGGRRAAQQRAEQLERARVRPVEVVEHQHERLALASVSSSRGARGGCGSARRGAGRRQRGQHVTELGARLGVKPSSRRGASPCTYSSSASTKTQNGRSPSSSDALPASTRWPRSSACARAPTAAASCRSPARPRSRAPSLAARAPALAPASRARRRARRAARQAAYDGASSRA